MGAGRSKDRAALAAAKVNQRIESQIKKDKRDAESVTKILLLGTGNCGKSTYLKQFLILHSKQGLGDPQTYRNSISGNVLRGLRKVLDLSTFVSQEEEADDNLRLTPEVREKLKFLNSSMTSIPDLTLWSEVEYIGQHVTVSELCKDIWKDPAVLELSRNKIHPIEEPLEYFMSRIDELDKDSYIPSQEDILHVRQRTVGVRTAHITFEGNEMDLIDVGGQKNERKKWLSHFQNVTAVIYIVSVGDYDMCLTEDSSQNRLIDALENFESIATCPFFENTNIILILNKKDVFLKKIRDKNQNLKDVLPDYDGEPGNYRDSINFIRKKFLEIFEKAHPKPPGQSTLALGPMIQMYNTVGTQTSNVRDVFNSCKQIILNQAISILEK